MAAIGVDSPTMFRTLGEVDRALITQRHVGDLTRLEIEAEPVDALAASAQCGDSFDDVHVVGGRRQRRQKPRHDGDPLAGALQQRP